MALCVHLGAPFSPALAAGCHPGQWISRVCPQEATSDSEQLLSLGDYFSGGFNYFPYLFQHLPNIDYIPIIFQKPENVTNAIL